MNKELEALDLLFYGYCFNSKVKQEYELIKQALQRLESIDNSNPSEVLELLRMIKFKSINAGYNDGFGCWNKIEQALLKSQEMKEDIIHYKGTVENLKRDNALLKEIKNKQEKVLNIMFENNVDIDFLKSADTFEEYNKLIKVKSAFAIDLAQEDFELLKRWTK